MANKFTNMFQSATKIIESLTDNSQMPLHVGETMACWTYLAFVGGIVTYEQVGLNTVTDPKLQEMIQEALKIAKSHKKQLSDFMRNEGVTLPTLPEDKPMSESSSIPLGAKLTEDEIINTLLINFVTAADMCAASASQSLRTDVGLMFVKFQMDKLSLGYQARDLMQKKGWLKIPPYYHPPGAPN
ncbi:DUF3231 family protein [Lentibacillus sp. Marseille-P4043]|uniref:DUF3231 family protein n=1 Tax=Lentibacillus sp. Marseille-P4043 TaxID=2040293 RepID=UPI00131A521B|nr:DUF3231 family protein [Lentibacillus sp. Marseille-P4043]